MGTINDKRNWLRKFTYKMAANESVLTKSEVLILINTKLMLTNENKCQVSSEN